MKKVEHKLVWNHEKVFSVYLEKQTVVFIVWVFFFKYPVYCLWIIGSLASRLQV